MSPVDSEMIVMFVMGGGFCLLLAGAMLAYIRHTRRGIVGVSDDADLRSEIDRLMLARTALDQDHQSGRISATDYAATCLDIDRRLLALSQQTPDTPDTPDTGHPRYQPGATPIRPSCHRSAARPASWRRRYLCVFGPSRSGR